MKRANRNLTLMTIVAAALVATVLIVGRSAYLRDPPALTRLDPADITHVELDIPPAKPQVLERRAGGWWRVKPTAVRADARRVRRLANLAATPVARWIPTAKVRPANVGLAPPSATLVINGVKLQYGGLAAIGHFRYVAVGGKIALVPRQYSPEVMLTKPAAK